MISTGDHITHTPLHCTALHQPLLCSNSLYSTPSQGTCYKAVYSVLDMNINCVFRSLQLPVQPYTILYCTVLSSEFPSDLRHPSPYFHSLCCIRSEGWAHSIENQKTSNPKFRLCEFSSESVARRAIYGSGSVPLTLDCVMRSTWRRRLIVSYRTWIRSFKIY